jgi:hypothetical protein
VITLRRALLEGTDSVDGVRTALRQAVQLEHATIPAYLYSLYSLAPGVNDHIARLIASVVIEEMSHMALACNMLNAIDGRPAIDDPAFLPSYPGPLPGSVETGLEVTLERFSIEHVRDVFMTIEEPERPLEFPVLEAATDTITIGEFYAGIRTALEGLGDAAFTGDPARQVIHGFPSSDLIAVTDVASAALAIEIIVEQGEGTTQSPLDGAGGGYAHYYRFAEIANGRELEPVPGGDYAYSGPRIAFDPAGVRPLPANPRAATTYPAKSAARYACDTFNYTYTGLLKTLQATFDGDPDRLGAAIGIMESLKEQALEMAEMGAGPSYEWRPLNTA